MSRKKRYRPRLAVQAQSARDEAICTLATEGGFYAKTIAKALTSRGFPTGTSTVYNVLGEQGISLRRYRRASDELSKTRLNTLLARHIRGRTKNAKLRIAV